MLILIIGGSRSKKSFYSEKIAENIYKKNTNSKINSHLYYLATMKPFDNEDVERISKHIENRKNHNYITIEKPDNLNELTSKFKNGDTVLLESLTSLITNEMFKDKEFIEDVKTKVFNDIKLIVKNVKNLIIVADYIFSDSIIYDKYTQIFKEQMGKLICELVEMADIVSEIVYGTMTIYKGEIPIINEKLI